MKLLKVREAAKILGISRTRAYAWIKEGRIPVVDFNGILRIPAEFIEEKIDNALTRVRGGKCT